MHGLIFVHVFQQSLCVCVCLDVLWISHRYMSALQPGQGGAYLKIVGFKTCRCLLFFFLGGSG